MPEQQAAGYHLKPIPFGQVGFPSKIIEEAMELEDAHDQNCKIMALTEAADVYLALEEYVLKHHPGYTMTDLRIMASATRRAFQSGQRKPKA